MEKVVIECKNLIKEYGQGEGRNFALNNVSMKIYEGELLVILGGSGCGKSTLLNMIGGMDKPTQGEVLFKDKSICGINDNKLTDYRKNNIGFIFQFFNLLNELTVKQNVMLAPGSNKNSLEVLKLLKDLGLESKVNKFPRMLSGGEQQRVAIARALNKSCDLLLCDEPTGALDDKTGIDTLKLIYDINKLKGKTVVIVTHTKEIANIADRVIVMHDGKIKKTYKNENPISPLEVTW